MKERSIMRYAAGLCLVCVTAGASAQGGIYSYTAPDGTLHLSDMPDNPHYRLMLRDSGDYRVIGGLGPDSAAASLTSDMPSEPNRRLQQQPFHAEIAAAARTHGIDPALIHAVISAESAYNPSAVSKKGAIGLMQLMPDTARRYRVRDARDPRQNIDGGVRYLNDLMRLFSGDLRLALAAYNSGENAVLRHGGRVPPYAETALYVPRVLALYRRHTGAGEGSARVPAARPSSTRASRSLY